MMMIIKRGRGRRLKLKDPVKIRLSAHGTLIFGWLDQLSDTPVWRQWASVLDA